MNQRMRNQISLRRRYSGGQLTFAIRAKLLFVAINGNRYRRWRFRRRGPTPPSLPPSSSSLQFIRRLRIIRRESSRYCVTISVQYWWGRRGQQSRDGRKLENWRAPSLRLADGYRAIPAVSGFSWKIFYSAREKIKLSFLRIRNRKWSETRIN